MIERIIPYKEQNAEIQGLYMQFKSDYHLKQMPNLFVNQITRDGSDAIHIVNDKSIRLLAELRMQPVDWYLYQNDRKPIFYHEFTHIWDAVEAWNIGEPDEPVFSTLSELHASYIEMQCRIGCSMTPVVSLDTDIPYLDHSIKISEYMNNTHDDICAFLSESVSTHKAEPLVRLWKHTQYYCARVCCLWEDCGIRYETYMKPGIPAELFVPFMNAMHRIREDATFVAHPDSHTIGAIKEANDFLVALT